MRLYMIYLQKANPNFRPLETWANIR